MSTLLRIIPALLKALADVVMVPRRLERRVADLEGCLDAFIAEERQAHKRIHERLDDLMLAMAQKVNT